MPYFNFESHHTWLPQESLSDLSPPLVGCHHQSGPALLVLDIDIQVGILPQQGLHLRQVTLPANGYKSCYRHCGGRAQTRQTEAASYSLTGLSLLTDKL